MGDESVLPRPRSASTSLRATALARAECTPWRARRSVDRCRVVHSAAVAQVLAIANQKGGVGKTTTVHTLGSALARTGSRVLLVDLDPQACLTYSVGLDPEVLPHSLHDVL